jgi:beta-lactamase class A
MTFFQPDRKLQDACDRIINTACHRYPLTRNQIGMTLLVYDTESIIDSATEDSADFWNRRIRGYSHRGIELVYPASIIKLFYMVALHEWLDKGMLTLSSEIERALRDTIVDSSNDATALLVDVISGTTGGPELAPGPFATWKYQRQIVNRYFYNLGVPEYSLINVCQKTWCDGPYGREREFYGENMENRNMLTTEATAHLLHSIMGGMAISRDRSSQMRQLLYRSIQPQDLAADPYNQVTDFLGAGLPQTAKLWSKAGLTSQVRHDAAYVEIPGSPAFMLIVFTEGDADNQEVLPFFSSSVVTELILPR